MPILNILQEIATGVRMGISKVFSTKVWIEIKTEKPACIYYFGPFENRFDAQKLVEGYVADLEGEGASGIQVAIKRCNPPVLTISREPIEASIW